MQRSRVAPIILGALILTAIVLGLAVTGGPEAGRLEKQDRVRAEDITRIARSYVPCLAGEADQTLPDSLAEDETCSEGLNTIRLIDPFTDLPYHYEKISDNRYRVCASFSRAELVAPDTYGGLEFDAKTGCLTKSYSSSLN